MKRTVVKFIACLMCILAFSSCDNSGFMKGSARLSLWRFKRYDMVTYVNDLFYQLGPAGWMIEFYEYPTSISTYVFCPDGDCNLTENSTEYAGIWRKDLDTIRIVFYQEIESKGVGKPYPMPQEHGFDYMQEYVAYLEKTNTVFFKRNLSWPDISESTASSNERPYKLISRDATCD